MRKRGKNVDEETRRKVIQLRKNYSVDYIANHLDRSKSEIYKILRQERKRPLHFAELSRTALWLADLFSQYRESYANITPYVYPEGSSQVTLETFLHIVSYLSGRIPVDKVRISNLLRHLKADTPGLADINDWSDLTPSMITEDLIMELRRRGSMGYFAGKCPGCPR
jgi:hypothetical protein